MRESSLRHALQLCVCEETEHRRKIEGVARPVIGVTTEYRVEPHPFPTSAPAIMILLSKRAELR